MSPIRKYNMLATIDWYITQLEGDSLSTERRNAYRTEAERLLHKLDNAVETWQKSGPEYKSRLEKAMER